MTEVTKIPIGACEVYIGKDNLINIRISIKKKEIDSHPELQTGAVAVDFLEEN